MLKASQNILLITARADFGGGPEHVYNLIKVLSRDFNLFVACPDDFPYKKRYAELISEDRIIIIPHREFKINSLLALRSFIKKNKIGLIHSHGKGAGIYGRLLALSSAVPCIHTFHGLHTGSYNTVQRFLYLLIERTLSVFTKKIISVSKGEYNELLTNKIAPGSRIAIIENGVVIPDVSSSDKNFNTDPKTITTITRFDFQKNTSQLITIFVELRKKGLAEKFNVVLLGTGQEEDQIKKTVEEQGLSRLFHFKGAVENPGEYLADSFCYLSTSRWEGLPLALLEAMSFGIPAIATDVTGNNDVIKHNETGFLYKPDAPEQAADFLVKLSGNYNLWKSFSDSSREIVKTRFSVEKMAEKTKNIYHSITNV